MTNLTKEIQLLTDLINQYGCANVTGDTESEAVKYMLDNNLATLARTGGECVGYSDTLLSIKSSTIYIQNGYSNRESYLRNLAEDNDQCYQDVLALAELLGEGEDFDGLVTSVEDMEFSGRDF